MRSVLLLRGIDVQSVVMRVVQEVALDAPYLVVHLVPFGARVNVNLHLVELQSAVTRLYYYGRARDKPSRPLAVKHFFAIGGNCESVDPADERLGLPRCEIEFRNRDRSVLLESRHIHSLGEKQDSSLARVQAHIVRRLNRQRYDALSDALQVDSDLDGLLLLLLAFLTLLSLFVLVGFFAFVCRIFLLFRRFFFVALRLHRRGIALLEDRRVNTPQNRMLEARQIKPARGKSYVCAYGKEQRFPVLIEYRMSRVADPVRDLRFFSRFHRVHENCTQMVLEQLGERQPFAVRRPCLTET